MSFRLALSLLFVLSLLYHVHLVFFHPPLLSYMVHLPLITSPTLSLSLFLPFNLLSSSSPTMHYNLILSLPFPHPTLYSQIIITSLLQAGVQHSDAARHAVAAMCPRPQLAIHGIL